MAMTYSNINMDFSQFVAIDTEAQEWIESPLAGVHRRMLEREKPESGRATSIVRYAPGSHFSPHTHDGGEEFLVLDGVFSDGYGDFGAGSYIRNPVGSQHRPHSEPGCTIFVKLWQMDPNDQTFVRTRATDGEWQAGLVDGHSVKPLHDYEMEHVGLVRLAAGTTFTTAVGAIGQEILVIEGDFADEHGTYGTGGWIRYPVGMAHCPSTDSGCRLYVKVGHLRPYADDSTDDRSLVTIVG
jgi:anti-sigma factor ChrR (cupin superfamily)